MRWLNPSFGVFHTLLSGWEAEMYKELDFNTEAKNLREVKQNLEIAGIAAVVPVPLLASDRCLVMSFAEGVKIADIESLSARDPSNQALLVDYIPPLS